MHAADSSGGLLSPVSLVMRVPLAGCHNCGTTYAVDWKLCSSNPLKIEQQKWEEEEEQMKQQNANLSQRIPFGTLPFPKFVNSIGDKG